jgi:chaperonin GroES
MPVETAEKKTTEKKAPLGFKPLKDRCFVSYTEELERTAGGIYVPDVAKEKPQRGKVEAVGAEVKSVKTGDVVLFDKYSGSKINVDGTDYLIIKEEDVLGIFEK